MQRGVALVVVGDVCPRAGMDEWIHEQETGRRWWVIRYNLDMAGAIGGRDGVGDGGGATWSTCATWLMAALCLPTPMI